MSLVVNKGLSALKSNSIELGLFGVNLKQNKIHLDGGYHFNFVDSFSDIVDFKTKNYTNFYLTSETKLDDKLQFNAYKSIPEKFLTTIRYGNTFLNILSADSEKIESIDNVYQLRFTDIPIYSQYFQFNFINESACEIYYDDGFGNNYIVLDSNNNCVLKRGILTTEADRLINYSIGETNNIVLYKTLNNNVLQLRFNNDILLASPLLSDAQDLIEGYSLKIDIPPEVNLNFSKNNSYVNYTNQSIDIDLNSSELNLKGNYLIHRNLSISKINNANIIALKNHTNDLNFSTRSNNLALNTSTDETYSKVYTSINNNIDATDSEDLNLNYVFYNKTISISPGINEFITEASMFPFTQININDTKLAKCGAFMSTSPLYADKVYNIERNNLNQEYVYLCTWLSGGSSSKTGTWVDRYYYPDLLSKQQAISGVNVFKDTYENFIEKIIFSNNQNVLDVSSKGFFDKKSDLAFKPNTRYIYERVDLDSLDFLSENILLTKPKGYYTDINNNNGFVLGLNLINQNDQIIRSLASDFNNIPGGLFINYSSTEVNITYNVYNTASGNIDSYSILTGLNLGSDNNVVISINNITGEIFFYVNGDLVYSNIIEPLKANTILYGDFIVSGRSLTDGAGLISEEYISSEPLTREQISLIVGRYNDSKSPLTISLPCGMRNKQDRILQLNSLSTNLKSKSDFININITDLDVDDNLKSEIVNTIELVTRRFIPTNTEINKISIL